MGSRNQAVQIHFGNIASPTAPKEILFNDIIDRCGQQFTKCSRCGSDIIRSRKISMAETDQRYVILQFHRFINIGSTVVELPTNITGFDPDNVLMFDKKWKMCGAIEYQGDQKQGHYLCWRRKGSKWTVLNDDVLTDVNDLLPGLRRYYMILFEEEKGKSLNKILK